MLYRRLLGGLLFLLLVACTPHAHDSDYAKMNTLPLQTYCVGRLLVDLPKQATFSWTQDIGEAKISRLDAPIQVGASPLKADQAFWAMVEKRKQELQSLPHQSGKGRLGEYRRIDDKIVMFLFRGDQFQDDIYDAESYLWLDHWGYQMVTGAHFDQEAREIVPTLADIFHHFTPIDNRTPPKQAGFCIDGALVTGEVGRISAGPTLYMTGMKGVSISVNALENVPPLADPAFNSAYGYLENEEREIRQTRESVPAWSSDPSAPKEFTVLRKREHTLNGLPGQEVIYRKVFNNGKREYQFMWRDSAPQNGRMPKGVIQISFDDQPDSNQPPYPPPPEDQMFALWDAVLNSVRPRPGAY